jgi:hypothetical protein
MSGTRIHLGCLIKNKSLGLGLSVIKQITTFRYSILCVPRGSIQYNKADYYLHILTNQSSSRQSAVQNVKKVKDSAG